MSAAATQAFRRLEERASSTTTVQASALHGGTFSVPLKFFISDALETERSLVPSLSFLLVHHDSSGKRTNIVYDLGLRRNTEEYKPAIRELLPAVQPMESSQDVRKTLLDGGVQPLDIDHIIISHVHWDHTGTPTDFPQSQFWVGDGALKILKEGLGGPLGTAHFQSDHFDGLNIKEFPCVPKDDNSSEATTTTGGWEKIGAFWVYDMMADGSIYVVDSPGHLHGHVNLLARIGPERWVYLLGDACHDIRLLSGEKRTAEWTDAEGNVCCIHTDKKEAEVTQAKIRDLQAAAGEIGIKLEVILAHGMEWVQANPQAFLPGTV